MFSSSQNVMRVDGATGLESHLSIELAQGSKSETFLEIDKPSGDTPQPQNGKGEAFHEDDLAPRNGSLLGHMSNIGTAIIGAGILGLPYSMARVGWGTGLILLLFAGFMSQWAFHLLNKVCVHLGGDQISFGYVSNRLNKWMPILADVLVILMCVVLTIVYLSVAGEFLREAFIFIVPDGDFHAWYLSRNFFVTIVFAVAAVPLSIPRKVTILQYTSAIAVVFVFYTVGVVVYYSAAASTETICSGFMASNNIDTCVGENCCVSEDPDALCCIGPVKAFNGGFRDLITALPIYVVSYSCTPQLLTAYNDLSKPTLKRLDFSTSVALLLCTVLYVVVAFGGYFTYGAEVSSNLLGSYPYNFGCTIARIGFAFQVTASYPLSMHASRDACVHLIAYIRMLSTGDDSILTNRYSRKSVILFYSVLIVLLLGTYGVAMADLDISFLLVLAGALSMSLLTFTIPGIFYFELMRAEGRTLTRLSALILIALGIFVMIINTVYGF